MHATFEVTLRPRPLLLQSLRDIATYLNGGGDNLHNRMCSWAWYALSVSSGNMAELRCALNPGQKSSAASIAKTVSYHVLRTLSRSICKAHANQRPASIVRARVSELIDY